MFDIPRFGPGSTDILVYLTVCNLEPPNHNCRIDNVGETKEIQTNTYNSRYAVT